MHRALLARLWSVRAARVVASILIVAWLCIGIASAVCQTEPSWAEIAAGALLWAGLLKLLRWQEQRLGRWAAAERGASSSRPGAMTASTR